MTVELLASDRAPGLHVAPATVIPDDAELAPFVTIYAGVELGSGISIEQGAILGRPQQLDARSRSPRRLAGEPTVIGDGCRVGSGTVVVAGARVGARTYLSDLVLVREAAVVGEDSMIGRGCAVSRDSIVGDRSRIQNNTVIAPWTRVGDDVLISPRVIFISDPTMGRRDSNGDRPEVIVERAVRIGTGAVIFPGITLGADSVVGAGAVVRDDVPARTVVVGVPARHLRNVDGAERFDDGADG